MVISRHITGKFRNYRYVVIWFLFLFYITLPWVSFNNTPIMRLDIPARKFYFLGNIFIPQEGYFLHLFLILSGIALFFFTTLIGRVWCGWACPQTVFTDIFDFIGRLIQKEKYGKPSASKISTLMVHFTWLIFANFASFSIVAYFNDPKTMTLNALIFQADGIYPYFIFGFTLILYFDMAFVREQFCIYACPYGKFQTILMDEHSYNVTYDYNRGEPRRNKKEKIGDCTSCNMCLVVCPTGIDIREGLNVGCIACTKCIDACTIQMKKENKKSLINYDSLARVEKKEKIKWLRPRSIIYGLLLLIISSATIYLLVHRVPIYISMQPDIKIQPQFISETESRNFYTLSIHNLDYKDKNLKFNIIDNSNSNSHKFVNGFGNEFNIKANSENSTRVFIESKWVKETQLDYTNLEIQVQDSNEKITIKKIPIWRVEK